MNNLSKFFGNSHTFGNSNTLRDDFFFPIQQRFDEVFDSFFSDGLDSVKGKSGYPKLEIVDENNGNWIIRVAVPGVKQEDISVEIEDVSVSPSTNVMLSQKYKKLHPLDKSCESKKIERDVKEAESLDKHTSKTSRIIRIIGKMSSEYESPLDSFWHHKELRKSAFTREVLLPDFIKDQPQASLADGILTLKWKKPEEKKEESKVIKVDIK